MEQEIFYSILVVCLNPGKRIESTLESIFRQTYTNYEVIIKDGGSTDGSKDKVHQLIEKSGMQEKVRWIESRDNGIYDAMNQAISYATGEYLLFLNAGTFMQILCWRILQRLRIRIRTCFMEICIIRHWIL